jgi:hypothetical protein
VVYAVGNAYRGDLLASCNNQIWLYRLVQALRQYDSRWGLNWKRGNVGDLSHDVVTYNFSADPDEGTTNVYIIDVIVGHCGSNPQAAWIDQTGRALSGDGRSSRTSRRAAFRRLAGMVSILAAEVISQVGQAYYCW